MSPSRAASAALLVVALTCGTARADDTRKTPPLPPPDPGFLEFLGGVDGLAEVNPDYLAQANHPAPPAPKPPASPPPPPPTVPGAKSND